MEIHVNYLVQRTVMNVIERLGYATKDAWMVSGGNNVMNHVIQNARTAYANIWMGSALSVVLLVSMVHLATNAAHHFAQIKYVTSTMDHVPRAV